MGRNIQAHNTLKEGFRELVIAEQTISINVIQLTLIRMRTTVTKTVLHTCAIQT